MAPSSVAFKFHRIN